MQRKKCSKCGATMKSVVNYNHITTYPHNEPQFAFPVFRDNCPDCAWFSRSSTAQLHVSYVRSVLRDYRSKFSDQKVPWGF